MEFFFIPRHALNILNVMKLPQFLQVNLRSKNKLNLFFAEENVLPHVLQGEGGTCLFVS